MWRNEFLQISMLSTAHSKNRNLWELFLFLPSSSVAKQTSTYASQMRVCCNLYICRYLWNFNKNFVFYAIFLYSIAFALSEFYLLCIHCLNFYFRLNLCESETTEPFFCWFQFRFLFVLLAEWMKWNSLKETPSFGFAVLPVGCGRWWHLLTSKWKIYVQNADGKYSRSHLSRRIVLHIISCTYCYRTTAPRSICCSAYGIGTKRLQAKQAKIKLNWRRSKDNLCFMKTYFMSVGAFVAQSICQPSQSDSCIRVYRLSICFVLAFGRVFTSPSDASCHLFYVISNMDLRTSYMIVHAHRSIPAEPAFALQWRVIHIVNAYNRSWLHSV